ncbi:MAG: PspC domain-containing protein [Propionibacteriaceae bacterium]|nr:PspC domain-containing protein [Propionibacteriaceae bacterium]
MTKGPLTRSKSNKVLGGVAGGIAAYTGLDLGITRVITAVACFTGIGLAAYAAAWALLPEEGKTTSAMEDLANRVYGKPGEPGAEPAPGSEWVPTPESDAVTEPEVVIEPEPVEPETPAEQG